MIDGAAIVAEARLWMGTPWKHQGALRGVGCDCIGLIGGVAAAVGLTDAWITEASRDFKGYGREPQPSRIAAGCAKWMTPIRRDQMQLGDVLVMLYESEQPRHFGIVSRMDPMYMIHALAGARKVVENIVDKTWQARIVGVYRLKGAT